MPTDIFDAPGIYALSTIGRKNFSGYAYSRGSNTFAVEEPPATYPGGGGGQAGHGGTNVHPNGYDYGGGGGGANGGGGNALVVLTYEYDTSYVPASCSIFASPFVTPMG
jgi:hypothetical protein